MLFFLTSRVISSLVAFLYPGYASYKTLSQRPASEEELERWLMYWSVLGFVVGIEYVAEWVISWIPFYYTLKTFFLLYIALPQFKGSSYLYKTHLQPFFRTHETQIDSTLARLKSRLYAFLQQRARMIWEQAAVAMGQAPSSYATSGTGRELEEEERVDAAQPPSLVNPMGGPMQLVSSLWGSYGPSILAGGMALVGAARTQAQSQYNQSSSGANTKRPGASVLTTPPSSRIRPSQNRTASGSTMSADERRRQLYAELRELDEDVPVSVIEGLPEGSNTTSRSSSDSIVHTMRRKDHVRSRSTSGGSARFEEIEVPSDVEGYNVTDGAGRHGGSAGANAAGGAGWFGGWSSASVAAAKSSQHVKND
ncbi:hypothetical protein NP233_g6383 [Leucocoprinus birnbaumii]|uniref:Protein YOP1 n=1 Tax=Leucocoprinus birnbaumii TaxID=56174 RepID=A0AAD5YVK8_9AGAR|nr:hypothetical protein NP233_g6383 [Leucocoprinus birnbaumii]